MAKSITFTKPHRYRNRDFQPDEVCSDVPDRDAAVLIAIGRAVETPTDEPSEKARRGRYNRRDMRAAP